MTTPTSTNRRKYLASFIFLSLLLLLPNLTGIFLAEDISGFGLTLIYFISAVLFWLIGLTILPQRLFFYLSSPILILNIIEIVYQVMDRRTTSVMFIYTVIAAEPGEFWELVTTYWPLFILAFLFIGLYFFICRRNIPAEPLLHHKSARRTIFSLCMLWFIICAGVLYHYKHLLQVHDDDYVSPTIFIGMSKSCPINMFVQSAHLAIVWDDINGQNRLLHDFKFGIEPKTDDNDEIVVLLVGETARYDHWALNGYSRPTSPLLSQRDGLISFDSCYSIANLTTISVPYMLSRATPQFNYPYSNEKSLPEAFAEAGYTTAWIADQSFTNTFLRRISASCDVCNYEPHTRIKGDFCDSILIAPLHKVLTQPRKNKQMIVIHSLGSHYKYTCRYPQEFRIFTPDLNEASAKDMLSEAIVEHNRIVRKVDSEQLINNIREVLVNSYDNTIVYTDFFINSVIQELEATGKPVVMLYVGDHGENLMDDERLMLMHGTFLGSRWEYHVPMFIWTSKQYRKLHPDKIDNLTANRTKQISTMNVFHTLLNLADIQYQNLDHTKCLDDTALVADTITWGLDGNLQLTIIPQ